MVLPTKEKQITENRLINSKIYLLNMHIISVSVINSKLSCHFIDQETVHIIFSNFRGSFYTLEDPDGLPITTVVHDLLLPRKTKVLLDNCPCYYTHCRYYYTMQPNQDDLEEDYFVGFQALFHVMRVLLSIRVYYKI